jgi:glycosyltransferase involved in cell wall biosynthesis
MNNIVKPLITTIIPTYRRPKLLQRAIRSVLNQTYPYFQVCVYDNASGDETASVVAELAKKDPRVKYHCHSENIGGHLNYVYGMEHVNTPFFSLLCDDDIFLPEFYQTAMDNLSKFPDAMFFAGSTIRMSDHGKVNDVTLYPWKREGYYTAPDGFYQILRHWILWTSILFRKEVIEDVGILDYDAAPSTDCDLILRIAIRFPFVISKKPCGIFVDHALSFSTYARTVDYLLEYLAGWHKIICNLTKDKRIPVDVRIYAERALANYIEQMLFSFWNVAIKQKNYEDARKLSGILNNYFHQNIKLFILYTMTKFKPYFPPVYYSIICLNKIRKLLNFRRSKPNKQLQKQFGDYAKFLELSE